MSTIKLYWTGLSFYYHKYVYTKIAGFFLWLGLSSIIYMTTTEGVLLQATTAEIVAYMFGAQVLGIMMTFAILFIPRLILRVPIAFGMFDEKH